jgi:DNA polymerase I-like protein with 3'-5' exonuclease and polymerase domains
VFKSRFEGGKICDADYSQLEFRVAGFLSGCPVVRKIIMDGVDVHSFTRDTINSQLPEASHIDRQDAKPDTFKPLYGGQSGTPAQRYYYSTFLDTYYGVKEWHENLKIEALSTGKVRIFSGREYLFPNAKRTANGYVVGSTQIVNYPCQGFATADLVPLGLIAVYRRMVREKVNSKLCLTTHDSGTSDTYPGEEQQVGKTFKEALLSLPEMVQEYYKKDFDFPLEVEIKIGDNWRDMKEIEI